MQDENKDITRGLLAGLMLVVFGSNKFLHFIDMQPGSIEMGAFMMALFGSGYLM